MRLLASMVLLGVLLVPTTSHAYSCIDESCPAWCGSVAYVIGNIPDGLDEAATVSAINDAMAAWAGPDCSAVAPTYMGRTTAGSATDGMTVIDFVETDWTNPTLGAWVSNPRWNDAGCIMEADIDLNAQDFTWSTTMPTDGTTANVFAQLLHAAGNIYGLGPSMDASAVMSSTNFGSVTALAADDVAGICSLYPDGPPCTDGACPMGEECVRDVCIPDPCAACGAGTRCVDGACVANSCQPCTAPAGDCPASSMCVAYPSGNRYCGAICTTDAECMDGESCLRLADASVCVRVIGGTPDCTSAAPPDAGVDASVPLDGSVTDTGPSGDNDAGTTDDAGPTADAGTRDDDDGCSCSAVGTRQDGPSALWLVVALGFAARLRRDKR